jgi:hypothetical protein
MREDGSVTVSCHFRRILCAYHFHLSLRVTALHRGATDLVVGPCTGELRDLEHSNINVGIFNMALSLWDDLYVQLIFKQAMEGDA